MTLDRDRPLQAAIRGDDGPGEGLRRLARQVHGDAERGAAAVRGLGGDGRVHPGSAGPPGKLQLHERRRLPGHRARQQRRRRRSTRSTRRRRPTPVPSQGPAASPCKATRMPDGRQVLDFSAPVLFQSKTIGTVHLGIYEAPLTAVANLVLVLLAILTVVTVAAVAGGTYLLAQRLAVPGPRAARTRWRSSPTAATTTASRRRARTSSASSTRSSTRPPPRSRSVTRAARRRRRAEASHRGL